MTEATFKYTHGGHDLAEVMVDFDGDKVTSVYTNSGDIVHFPRDVTAWRPMQLGFIDADDPQKVWEYIKASPDKWKTTDPVPEGA